MPKIIKRILIAVSSIIGFLVLCALVVVIYLFIENTTVSCSSYETVSKKVPFDFDGYKIGLITDFHNGTNYEKILKKIKKEAPDIITVVGDTINSNETSFENAKKLLEGLVTIAPTYLVSGNHERWADEAVYKQFLEYAAGAGVVCMDNKVQTLQIRNASINLAGAQDEVYSDDLIDRYDDVVNKNLDQLYKKIENKELFTVLLYHRGNLVEKPAKYGYDLILSGHLHGGIVNLPVIRDKILKSHGDSTKYYKGKYQVEDSQVIISGGLESKKDEIRVLNPPEIVMVTLRSKL